PRSARAPDARRVAAVISARARPDARDRVSPRAPVRAAPGRQGNLLRRLAASDRMDGACPGREHRRRSDPGRAAAGGADPMIPEHVMRELRYIEVYTGKRIRNLRVGPYTSPLRGPGFDFDEHQPYRHGDDVRRIDWNVTARMNAPFVRHTHAERELNVMIAIDASRSMELGAAHRSKKELMTFITGSLLFSAVSDQINTGFLAFSDRVLEYQPPRRTRAAAWSVLERCWALSPRPGPTALLPAVRHLLTALKRMSVVFIVSDFISGEDLF